ncbi:MAG: T9SS type A sorting domain-containing protein [Candidatus Marinimicrobia bacterium]|nr:T9SS type A sorting domain-containing protein [Candidatus Neomarinimicrobiota bacterium]
MDKGLRKRMMVFRVGRKFRHDSDADSKPFEISKCINTVLKKLRILLIFIIVTQILNAQWSNDPSVNTTIVNTYGGQVMPLAVSDGKGGAIIFFHERGQELYAQRIGWDGYLRWDSAGVPVCTAPNPQFAEAVLSDGKGGSFVVWMDYREYTGSATFNLTTNSLYVQRIDSNGVCLWQNDGVLVRSFLNMEEKPTYQEALAEDGHGGVFIIWVDRRTAESIYDLGKIYLQHVDSSGVVLFEPDGMLIGDLEDPRILSDDSSGVYVFRECIFGQRYSYYGQPLWDQEILVDSAATCGNVVKDGHGGFIYAGLRFPSLRPKYIGLQRINRRGDKLWNTKRLYLDEPALDWSLDAISDMSSGIIIGWIEEYSEKKIAQRIDSLGTFLWPNKGIQRLGSLKISDCRSGILGPYVLHDSLEKGCVQRIDANGNFSWGEVGAVMFQRVDLISSGWGYWQFVSDLRGGGILIWDELSEVTGNIDIFAQHVDSEGKLGPVSAIKNINPPVQVIDQFRIDSLYPNPFNSTLIIKYTIHKKTNINIKVYDIKGEEVTKLFNGDCSPGDYQIRWNGTNTFGLPVGNGLYILRMSSPSQTISKKIALIK